MHQVTTSLKHFLYLITINLIFLSPYELWAANDWVNDYMDSQVINLDEEAEAMGIVDSQEGTTPMWKGKLKEWKGLAEHKDGASLASFEELLATLEASNSISSDSVESFKKWVEAMKVVMDIGDSSMRDHAHDQILAVTQMLREHYSPTQAEVSDVIVDYLP